MATTLRAIWLLVALLLAGATARGASIDDIRVENDGAGKARCEIILSEATLYRVRDASGTEQRVSLEIAGIRRGPFALNGEGGSPVSAARVQHVPEKQLYYVHLETTGEVTTSAQMLSDPWRIVVEVSSAAVAAPQPGEAPGLVLGPAASGGSAAPSPPQQGGMILGPGPSTPAPTPMPIPGPVARPTPMPSPTPPLPAPPPTNAAGRFVPRIIVVDAGHGGKHRGGIGRLNGKQVDEATAVMPIAIELERLLRADPMFEPRMTRRTDEYIGLRERTRRAEQFGGHLFVSIHYNAVPKGSASTARGLEIFTWSPKDSDNVATRYLQQLENEEGGGTDVGRAHPQARPVLTQMMIDSLMEQAWESKRVASAMERAFLTDSCFKRHYRGLKTGRFKVLENYSMPSVLVEVGFITHPEEVKLAFDSAFQRKAARLMYDGIVRYYEETDPGFRAARAQVLAQRR